MAAPPLHVVQIPPPADVGAPPADAIRTGPSGDRWHFIFSKVLAAGTGSGHPGAGDRVTVHYTAWTTDGTTIDDSRSRGAPAVWVMRQLPDGLSWGLALMVEGEKRRLWVPGGMAHEWATDMIVYDVELVSHTNAGRPTREEINRPPSDATRIDEGLACKVLQPARGAERPKPTSTVTIHYTEWADDGAIVDDSVARGAPLTIALDTVFRGLSWAVQRMAVGERTRFWIPAELGYAQAPLRRRLLFDVELLAIGHSVDGSPGIVTIRSNSPDVAYSLTAPDGNVAYATGARTFRNAAPGPYRLHAIRMANYAVGIVSAPADMTLAPGGTLEITINVVPDLR